jgi:hypothetical protein
MITHSKLLLLIFLLCSCQEIFKSKSELYYKKRTDSLNAQRKTVQDTTLETKKIKLAKLDTTIFLNMPKSVGGNGKNGIMTDEMVKKVLFTHYKRQGFISDIERDASNFIQNTNCVLFNNAYFADLNNDSYTDAILTYWLMGCTSSGHCFQPTKAILLNNKGKLKIQDIDFIPTNYTIDSVKLVNDFVKIYGYDYDCVNHQVIKNFEITLQSE